MVVVGWIDTIYDGNNRMTLQAYDEDGKLIFEKELEASKQEAKETAHNIWRKNLSSEFYNYE